MNCRKKPACCLSMEVLGATPGWLRCAARANERQVCIGQKQVWFLLRLTGDESHVKLDHTDSPEFDHWRWVDFWYPVEHVVVFKRGVYARTASSGAFGARGRRTGRNRHAQERRRGLMPGHTAGHDRPRKPADARLLAEEGHG